MSIIEAELGNALQSAVKRTRNSTKNLRAGKGSQSKAARVSSGSKEVMVKVTGFCKGANHIKAHMEYISRNGEVEIENEKGEISKGYEGVKDTYREWEANLKEEKSRRGARDSMNVMLSMPAGVDPDSVKKAVRQFAASEFGKNHQYVIALHTDQAHPHCHVTVKCRGFDGKNLNPRKEDLERWRVGFAEKLREQGVDAVASPRRSRGVTKKAESAVVRHIEAGDKTHEPRVSKVRASKTAQAVKEIISESKGIATPEKPWEKAAKSKQKEIRKSWLSAAQELDKNNSQITVNQQGMKNVRPVYDRISNSDARAGQRAAAVYQSNSQVNRQDVPARALTGVRNLSKLNVVHDERTTQVLLRKNAPSRLGRNRVANPQVRRPGIGADRDEGRARGVSQGQGSSQQNAALAARIRTLVAAMPAIDAGITERAQLKIDLTKQFQRQQVKEVARDAKAVDAALEATPRVAPIVGIKPAERPGQDAQSTNKNGANKFAPLPKEKDIER